MQIFPSRNKLALFKKIVSDALNEQKAIAKRALQSGASKQPEVKTDKKQTKADKKAVKQTPQPQRPQTVQNVRRIERAPAVEDVVEVEEDDDQKIENLFNDLPPAYEA